ncbi:MAG: SAM-dependent methyltransferase [Magnetococcales bacterium]|nr:SAM-dependent methyltransferase [Magnetococcales bacterium]
MTALKEHIIRHIEENGPISLADYMGMCLYTEDEGYYMHGMPFGKDGDFITAPELTPLFGEMLGLWVAATWQQMGAPESFCLVEFGPGRGTLYTDMLRAIGKALPQCLNALEGHLVDISPNLRQHQQTTLQGALPTIKWHSSIADVPFNKPTIVIGNELLDAFPVEQYEQVDGKYYQRLVTTENDTLKLTRADEPSEVESLAEVTEQSPAMENFLAELRDHLERAPQAAALLIDYGSEKAIAGETLQALRKHKYEGIFDTPGQADLTWHIPFKRVCDILGDTHSVVTDMALFLTEIGYNIRAEQALRAARTPEEKEHIEATSHRLIDPNQMGAHFKVLGWCSDNLKQLQGFQHCYADSE